MFATLHRLHRDGRMHVVGRGDIHRVEIVRLLLQQLPPVLVNAHAGIFLDDVQGPGEVHIRDRD